MPPLASDLRRQLDARLSEVCRAEGRAIDSFDLDFANVRDYPPGDYPKESPSP